MNIIWIASFDIGKKNFAFCVEEINVSTMNKIVNIPMTRRYNKDGTCTDEYKCIIRSVYNNGNIKLLENIDITTGCDKSKYLDPKTFINMTQLLDKYKEYWNKCSVFIIEQQMSFGNKRNVMALKLGQHCYSYFIFQYGVFKTVVEFPAYHKTKVLGATKKITKPQRKKWSIIEAKEILTIRNDTDNLDKINKSKKQDDLCDVITQLQAYKYITFIDN